MSAWLIDTHVWLALTFQNHPGHGLARSAFLAATPEIPWLWCRATQQSFLRLASTPAITRVYDETRVTNQDAWMALEMLLARPEVTVVDEPPGVMGLLGRLGAVEAAAPRRWMDAYLAAVAIAGGWRFLTLDRDFLAFRTEGLQLELLDGR